MDFKFKNHFIVSALMGGLLLAPEMQAATYAVTQLGNAYNGGSGFDNAKGINNSGQVVGYSSTGGFAQGAVLWQPSSNTPTVLISGIPNGGLPFYDGANGINSSGQVVGYSGGGNSTHAALWQPGSTTAIDLNTLGGGGLFGGNSTATSINNSGQVVGYSNSNISPYTGSAMSYFGGSPHAVLWQSGSTTPIDLGSPVSSNGFSQATGINDSGQVVGYAGSGSGGASAFLWESGSTTATWLGGLGGDISKASAINASGQIVGDSTYMPPGYIYGDSHAVLWQSGSTTATDLGTLGGSGSAATGINTGGQVVGWANITSSSLQHAAIWQSGSTNAIDLNSLVGLSSGYLTQALGINDKGQIIAMDSNNYIDLLTLNVAPVPVPSTIWFFGSVLAGFIRFNRRKQM